MATWNILWVDVDRERRLSSIADELAQSRAHVVCLQEAWPTAASELARRLGMRVAAAAAVDGSDKLQNAILTSLPPDVELPSEQVVLDGWDDQGIRRGAAAARVVTPGGRPWRITTTHLAWGSRSEGLRLAQARQLDELAQASQVRTPALAQLLCGDFNALPDSATLRFLRGLDPAPDGSSTQWVDAWLATRSDDGYTSDPSNPLALHAAQQVGILDVALVPARRIDFVLARGFCYGRPGAPLRSSLLGTGTNAPSDHYGIVVDLWNPPGSTPVQW